MMINAKPMREKFLLQKRILRASCWKQEKNAIGPNDPLPVQVAKQAAQKCDWGLDEVTPVCKNCIYFRIIEIRAHGRAAVSDDIIDKSDVPVIAREMIEKGRNEEVEYQEKARLEIAKSESILSKE